MIPGAIKIYPAAAAPSGWLLCDGTAVSRATYAPLFGIIGTTFGVGDGSTTFNLPDMQGKTIFGKDAAESDFDAIGKTGGVTEVDMEHSHADNNHTHGGSGTSSGGAGNQQLSDSNSGYSNRTTHTHPTTVSLASGGSAGSDTKLSSTQSVLNPYIVMNYIIKS